MRIHDVLAAAQLFIIARRRAAGAEGNERERELWHHVREHLSFIYERGQVYRFEDYLDEHSPTRPSRESAAFNARRDTVSREAMDLLLETQERVSTSEEKQLVRVLISLLDYVSDSGQQGAFEVFLNSRGEPPPVTASFSSLDEAKEWLMNLPEPPHRAHVLIGDDYHEAWYSREDGIRDLSREWVIEPLLEGLTRQGAPPVVASFDTRERAETWLLKHPASPMLFVSIAGEHHLAVYHEKLNRHSLHALARGLKEWEEEKRRAVERQKEMDAAGAEVEERD